MSAPFSRAFGRHATTVYSGRGSRHSYEMKTGSPTSASQNETVSQNWQPSTEGVRPTRRITSACAVTQGQPTIQSGQQFICNWLSCFRDSRRLIFPQKGRESGGNLILRDRCNFGALAETRCIWTEESHPDVLRTWNFLAMVAPFMRSLSPAMVGGKDESCIAAVFGHGLNQFAKSPQVGVHPAGRIEVIRVSSRVRLIVCFTERKIQDARLSHLQIFHCGVKGDGIEWFIVPHAWRLRLEAIQ